MTADDLLDAIGEINPDFVKEAEDVRNLGHTIPNKGWKRKYISIALGFAACAAVTIGVGYFNQVLNQGGSKSSCGTPMDFAESAVDSEEEEFQVGNAGVAAEAPDMEKNISEEAVGDLSEKEEAVEDLNKKEEAVKALSEKESVKFSDKELQEAQKFAEEYCEESGIEVESLELEKEEIREAYRKDHDLGEGILFKLTTSDGTYDLYVEREGKSWKANFSSDFWN